MKDFLSGDKLINFVGEDMSNIVEFISKNTVSMTYESALAVADIEITSTHEFYGLNDKYSRDPLVTVKLLDSEGNPILDAGVLRLNVSVVDGDIYPDTVLEEDGVEPNEDGEYVFTINISQTGELIFTPESDEIELPEGKFVKIISDNLTWIVNEELSDIYVDKTTILADGEDFAKAVVGVFFYDPYDVMADPNAGTWSNENSIALEDPSLVQIVTAEGNEPLAIIEDSTDPHEPGGFKFIIKSKVAGDEELTFKVVYDKHELILPS